MKSKISDLFPRKEEMTPVNFAVSKTLFDKFSVKLKKEKIKKTEFFRAVMAAYLKEEL